MRLLSSKTTATLSAAMVAFMALSSLNTATGFVVGPSAVTFAVQKQRNAVFSTTQMHMVGNFFAGSKAADDKVNAELANFPNLSKSASDSDVAFAGLVDYLDQWSKVFDEDPKSMKLSTPVKRSRSESNSSTAAVKSEGFRLVFQNTSTGYKNKREEDAGGAYSDSKPKGSAKKKEDKKEGGVEILVEQLEDGSVQVRARRCEVDEGTMIKEMSEETIISALKKVMGAWSKK